MTPNEIYQKLLQAGQTWAELDGSARLLEETRKTLLSQLSMEYIKKGESSAKAECQAMASADYDLHIRSMVDARTEANNARARLDAAKAWFDAWRTQESSKRAEMKMGGAVT